MRARFLFYIIVAVATILDSLLLSSPNLLGKIGLVIYKYHYLRTFPRTLLTVAIVIIIASLISELIRLLVSRQAIGRKAGKVTLLLLISVSTAALIKTGLDFSTWSYGHTGSRFKYGGYLLPVLLLVIFTYHLMSLPTPGRTPQRQPPNEK